MAGGAPGQLARDRRNLFRGNRFRSCGLGLRMPPRGETRRRMLDAAIVVMRERGAVGLSIDEVLARSGCPRGSVYHHFPGGRAELLRRTLEYAGESYAGMIERAAAKGGSAGC
ncbi:TetR/AcrR family transcriptional regulator [Mycolicibacter longobardus]|uniref:TetR/AcrR family transcriptional regulator n=1 Tax=Mycolicibacter longobardus TaxID=1108812 RepID=UPI0039088821